MDENLLLDRAAVESEAPIAETDALARRLQAMALSAAQMRARLYEHSRSCDELRANIGWLRWNIQETKLKADSLADFAAVLTQPRPKLRVKRLRWTLILPYAVIAATGLALSLATREARKGPARLKQKPAPTRAQAAAAPISFIDEKLDERQDAHDEALALIYAYRPAHSRRSVSDILAPILLREDEPPSWVIEESENSTLLVTLRQDENGSGALYEFEVDAKSGTVTPSPRTLELLRSFRS